MIKAQCPYCGSFKVSNYGLNNTAIEKDELEISSIMVECSNCGKFYDVVV